MLRKPENIERLIKYQHSHAGFCEALLSFCYNETLKPGDNFIDVGARIGHHLFPMARLVGPKGRGIAIDANPWATEQLRARIKENRNFKSTLKVVEAAASDQTGKAKFFVSNEYSGWSSLYESHVHPNESQPQKEIEVDFILLDELVSSTRWKACKFIKLDIENAEFVALRGAKTLLSKFRPQVVFENSPRRAAKLNGYSLKDFAVFFKENDYVLYDIFMNRVSLKRLRQDALLPSYYIATPSEDNVVTRDFVQKARAEARKFMDARRKTKENQSKPKNKA